MWSSSSHFSNCRHLARVRVPGEYTSNFSNLASSSRYPLNYSASSWYSLIKPLAAGMAITAWQGSQDDERTMKHVIHTNCQLPINSTFNNTTLPYFTVTKLEWISDPRKELPQVVLDSWSNFSDWNPFHPTPGIVTSSGTFAMTPDTWGILTPPSPYPGIISET